MKVGVIGRIQHNEKMIAICEKLKLHIIVYKEQYDEA